MKKRLFIAVDISDEARAAAALYVNKLTSRFRDVPAKWERPEKLHITLKFLGSTEEGKLDGVIDIVETSAQNTGPFEIEIAGTSSFPSPKSPRLLWLGVNEPSGTLKDLAERIDRHCAKFGFEKEKRVFKPHLTIARIRDPRTAADLGIAHDAGGFGPIKFDCDELILYESELGRAGSVYSKLAVAKFELQ